MSGSTWMSMGRLFQVTGKTGKGKLIHTPLEHIGGVLISLPKAVSR